MFCLGARRFVEHHDARTFRGCNVIVLVVAVALVVVVVVGAAALGVVFFRTVFRKLNNAGHTKATMVVIRGLTSAFASCEAI